MSKPEMGNDFELIECAECFASLVISSVLGEN